MSLPDHLLEEPEYCEEHGRVLPCLACRMDAEDEWSDDFTEIDERETQP